MFSLLSAPTHLSCVSWPLVQWSTPKDDVSRTESVFISQEHCYSTLPFSPNLGLEAGALYRFKIKFYHCVQHQSHIKQGHLLKIPFMFIYYKTREQNKGLRGMASYCWKSPTLATWQHIPWLCLFSQLHLSPVKTTPLEPKCSSQWARNRHSIYSLLEL